VPEATFIEFGGGSPSGGDGAGGSGSSAPPAGRGSVCPVCKQQFSGSDARFCPFDGEPLVDSHWDPSGDPLVGTVIDGRYEVMQVLGEGGMGIVYRIRHKALERPLALKALRRDLSQDADLPMRFIQEAKAAAAVEHPNVVQITDFGTLPTGQPYFVMELLEGDALSTILRERGPMTVSRAVGIAIHVAEALAAAHAAGVVHRDLKPDNIHVRRLGAQDVVKVLDFGLAKVAGTSRLTRAGMVFGTPHYMSPEQAGGEPSDHRVDVYALGVLLFEMLTGKLPFEADTFTGVLAMHMYMEPRRPSEVAGAQLGPVDDVVAKCMAKKPADRYATMGDLLADLDRVAAVLTIPPEPSVRRRVEEPITGEMAMSFERPGSGLSRRWPLVAAAVGVLALVIGLVAWLAGRGDDSSAVAVGSGEAASLAVAPPPASNEPPAPGPESSQQPEPGPAPAASASPEPPAASARPTNTAPKRPIARPPRPASGGGKPKGMGGGEIIDPWGR